MRKRRERILPDRRFLTILFAAGILFGGMADPFVPIRGGGVCLAQAPANPAPEAEPGRRQVPLPGSGGPQAVKTAPPSSAPMAADPAPAAEPPRQQELLPSRGGPQPVTAQPGTIRAPSAAAALHAQHGARQQRAAFGLRRPQPSALLLAGPRPTTTGCVRPAPPAAFGATPHRASPDNQRLVLTGPGPSGAA